MSKIAEQKALEAYSILFSERNGYDNTFKDRRESYIKGYDQAFQDFMEKACEWLKYNNKWHYGEIDLYIKYFKNYMKNESN